MFTSKFHHKKFSKNSNDTEDLMKKEMERSLRERENFRGKHQSNFASVPNKKTKLLISFMEYAEKISKAKFNRRSKEMIKEMDKTKDRFMDDVFKINRLIEIEKEAMKLEQNEPKENPRNNILVSEPDQTRKHSSTSEFGETRFSRKFGERGLSQDLSLNFSHYNQMDQNIRQSTDKKSSKRENLDMLDVREITIFKRSEKDMFYNTDYQEHKKRRMLDRTNLKLKETKRSRSQTEPQEPVGFGFHKETDHKERVPRNFVRKFRKLLIGSEVSRRSGKEKAFKETEKYLNQRAMSLNEKRNVLEGVLEDKTKLHLDHNYLKWQVSIKGKAKTKERERKRQKQLVKYTEVLEVIYEEEFDRVTPKTLLLINNLTKCLETGEIISRGQREKLVKGISGNEEEKNVEKILQIFEDILDPI